VNKMPYEVWLRPRRLGYWVRSTRHHNRHLAEAQMHREAKHRPNVPMRVVRVEVEL
jgi:hypothetical protein